MLYDGDPPEAINDSLVDKPSHREGRILQNFERKMHLKKKRANVKLVSSFFVIYCPDVCNLLGI